MARTLKPFQRKGKYRSAEMAAAMNAPAGARGLGGGLLLGFSTCDLANERAPQEGETYVAPLNRLRAVHHKADKMFWHFEPILGTSQGGTDIIELALDSALSTECWNNIANLIGGTAVGDTFVWVHNKCSRGDNVNGDPVLIPNATLTSVSLAGA